MSENYKIVVYVISLIIAMTINIVISKLISLSLYSKFKLIFSFNENCTTFDM